MADKELNGGVPPKATPGAPRPITVRLKPVIAKTDTQKTAEAIDKKTSQSIPKETVIAASAGRTARVPIPDLDDLVGVTTPKATSASATVKLRPVKAPGALGGAAKKPASPLTPVATPVKASHKPGSNPLPPGPKPPSDVQVRDDGFRMLKQYAKYASDIDVISYNSYRGKNGFDFLNLNHINKLKNHCIPI